VAKKTATAGSAAASKTTKPAPAIIPPEATHLRDEEWLAGQREALMRERASYTTSAERLAAEAAALMADREPGDVQFDEESGEGDTIAVERDRDLALSAAARQAVTEIDNALARLESNTYGLCLVGNDVIPKERLEAIPEASVCVQHKTSMF
jgi:RNA polymerase-binding transcription factor DksA